MRRLGRIRATRDAGKVEATLAALRRCAETGQGNLLALRGRGGARAGHRGRDLGGAGEGRGAATRREIRSISGVYGGHFADDADWKAMRAEIDRFVREHGRRPRLLVAKVGQDGHDRGAKVIATAFADLGFDVDVGTLFQTPEEVARQAVENDVHVIGVSTQSGGHKTLVPQLVAGARAARRERHPRHRRRHHPGQGLRHARAGRREGHLRSGHQRSQGGAPRARAHRTSRSQRRTGPAASGRRRAGARDRRAARGRPCARGDRRALAKAITLVESSARRTIRSAAQRLLELLLPDTGHAARVGVTRRARRRQEHVHRGLRAASDRAGQARRGAGGRSVERALGRQHPRRQDAHGAPGGGAGGVHPAEPVRRLARRRRAPDARGDAGVRGGRLRRRPGRDGRRRAVRGHRRLDGRLLPGAHAARARATSCRASRRASSRSPTRSP